MSDELFNVMTPFADVAELGQGYMNRADGERLWVPLPIQATEDAQIQFVIHLADGVPAFAGAGRCIQIADQGEEVDPSVRFEALLDSLLFDERSQPVYDYIVAVRAAMLGEDFAEGEAAAQAVEHEEAAGGDAYAYVEDGQYEVATVEPPVGDDSGHADYAFEDHEQRSGPNDDDFTNVVAASEIGGGEYVDVSAETSSIAPEAAHPGAHTIVAQQADEAIGDVGYSEADDDDEVAVESHGGMEMETRESAHDPIAVDAAEHGAQLPVHEAPADEGLATHAQWSQAEHEQQADAYAEAYPVEATDEDLAESVADADDGVVVADDRWHGGGMLPPAGGTRLETQLQQPAPLPDHLRIPMDLTTRRSGSGRPAEEAVETVINPSIMPIATGILTRPAIALHFRPVRALGPARSVSTGQFQYPPGMLPTPAQLPRYFTDGNAAMAVQPDEVYPPELADLQEAEVSVDPMQDYEVEDDGAPPVVVGPEGFMRRRDN